MAKLSDTNIDVGIESLPIGFIFPVANTNTPPSGTLECDGSEISQTTYADLFSGQPLSLSSYYGAAGGGNFRLPDYRGRAMRGWAHGSTRDPDRASRTADQAGGPTGDNVGSVQSDEFASHTHGIADNDNDTTEAGDGDNEARPNEGRQSTARGGNETRMKNSNVLWVIKY
jgi:microcystin-dependent protein